MFSEKKIAFAFALCAILILFLIPISLLAQKQGQPLIDSLLKELPHQKEDTNKVNVLHDLSSAYNTIAPDEGIKYGRQSLELATNLGWKKGIRSANNDLGVNYEWKSDYPKALEYYFKSLKLNEEIGNKKGIASVTGNIGNIYDDQGDYPKAFEYSFKALKLHEELGDKRGIAGNTSNIGIIYYDQKDYPKALEYYFKALKLKEELGDKGGIANTTGNIGAVYQEQKNYIMSVEYKQRALKLSEELGDKFGIAANLANIGATYISIVEDTAAKMGIVTGVAELPVNKYQLTASIPQGQAALLAGAIDYEHRALVIDKEIKALDLMQVSYERLTEAYKLKGDYKKAMENFESYTAIKDSVFSKENDEKIVKMGVKYEYDRQRFADSVKTDAKEKIQAVKQQKQTILNIVLIISLAVGMLIIVVIVNVYRQTLRKNTLLSEQKQIIDGQNKELSKNIGEKDRILTVVAHDLRSPVGAVAYLADIMLMEGVQSMQPKESLTMIKNASASSLELINELLGLSNNNKEDLEKEKTELNSFVKDCVTLLRYKATEKRQAIIMQQWESPVTVFISREKMSRVINNLVSNAIKFTEIGGEISITVQENDTSVLIIVKDNGIGIPEAMKADVFEIFTTSKRKGTGGEKSFGLGLSICRQIVAAHGGDIRLESEEGKGTTFYVELNT